MEQKLTKEMDGKTYLIEREGTQEILRLEHLVPPLYILFE